MNHTSLPNRRVRMAGRRQHVGAVVLLGAFALATALDACALSHPSRPLAQTIPVGRLPDALAIDPLAGRAFVADDGDATVSALDLATGRVVRSVASGVPNAPAPLALAVDTQTHRLFVAEHTDNDAHSAVYLFDTRSGTPLAIIRVGPEVSALAVDAPHNRVVVATEEGSSISLPSAARRGVLAPGSISLLDARTGAIVRKIRLGVVPVAGAVDARTGRAFILGWPLQQGYEAGAAQVSTIDMQSDAFIGSATVGRGAGAVVVDPRTARVFVANGADDTVSVLDGRNGALLRTVAVGWHPAAMAVDDRQGRVFVVNAGEGSLSVLDARNGALIRKLPVFPAATSSTVMMPYALAVDASRARVYVTAWGELDHMGLPTGNGQLAVLDARDYRLLRMIAVGVAPRAVTVGLRSGRIVVVNGGGAIRTPNWMERWRHIAGRAPWLGWIVPRPPKVVLAPGSVQVIDPRA